MNPLRVLAEWLDIRPHEVRAVLLSFSGAFLVIGFLILARSLREAFYLTSFDVKTLPYITAAVAALGLPSIGLFTKLLARYHARQVVRSTLLLMVAGLLLLWPFLTAYRAVVVIFYLWTAVGTLILTTGFWVITSELFPLRSAKRLFGLISAGGTSGALVIGTSLSWLTTVAPVIWLIPLLMAILLLFFVVETCLPQLEDDRAETKDKPEQTSIREGLSKVWQNPHLRTIGLIVMIATMATTLLDYQFKELLRAEITTKEGLTAFFGAFYAWTGLASLVVQLLLAARILKVFGIGWTVSVLPIIVLLGSAGFFFFPSLVLVTLVRGADNSLRKSLHRSVIEVLYVPIPSALRRKTKAFIDSVLDSMAEGIGAGIIFLWVTWANFPSVYLSVAVIGLTGAFLVAGRHMNKEYFKTLVKRLQAGDKEAGELASDERIVGRDLLTSSMTFMDLTAQLRQMGLDQAAPPSEPKSRQLPQMPQTTLDKIRSSNNATVLQALQECDEWTAEHGPDLIRLLARDVLTDPVMKVLVQLGPDVIRPLVQTLQDEEADFVIRRRIPRVLAQIDASEADKALVDALFAKRFEIRYRAAIALIRRRRQGLPQSQQPWETRVWDAIGYEVSHAKAVWEMQRLLDDMTEEDQDDLHGQRVTVRGSLSLEHTFRLLALVLDPQLVRTAFHGIILKDENLKSIALEYIEQVLPDDVRNKLWPFIGDISEHQRLKTARPLEDVVSDLIKTGATLFETDKEKQSLRKALDARKSEEE